MPSKNATANPTEASPTKIDIKIATKKNIKIKLVKVFNLQKFFTH